MARKYKIVLFLFLSVMLHTALALLLSNRNSLYAAGSTITLSLLPPENRTTASSYSLMSAGAIRAPRASGQSLANAENAHLPAVAQRADAATGLSRAELPGEMAVASHTLPGAGAANKNRIQAMATGRELKTMLQNNIARNFKYPAVALRHGWQGRVTIDVRIEPDGYISFTKLLISSGYQALDRAALKGAREVKSLPNAVALLQGRAFNITLPVIYRLRDS